MKESPIVEYSQQINPLYLPPESLWQAVEPLLPEEAPKPKGGAPRKPDRQMFFAIYYILRTGIQWNALPRCLGASSTVHDRFQQWVHAGVFHELWRLGILQCYLEGTLDFTWQSIDGCMTKAPLGGAATGPNPTDRGKAGTKRHLLTDAGGLPIGMVVTGANRHDLTQVQAVLESMPFHREIDEEYPQHFCADKGYDFDSIRFVIDSYGYKDHIKSRADERVAAPIPGYRARRWVCERTHSWMNRYRRICVRWEKKLGNYLAFLHLLCAALVWSRSQVFG
jgi:putative transposase